MPSFFATFSLSSVQCVYFPPSWHNPLCFPIQWYGFSPIFLAQLCPRFSPVGSPFRNSDFSFQIFLQTWSLFHSKNLFFYTSCFILQFAQDGFISNLGVNIFKPSSRKIMEGAISNSNHCARQADDIVWHAEVWGG